VNLAAENGLFSNEVFVVPMQLLAPAAAAAPVLPLAVPPKYRYGMLLRGPFAGHIVCLQRTAAGGLTASVVPNLRPQPPALQTGEWQVPVWLTDLQLTTAWNDWAAGEDAPLLLPVGVRRLTGV
jgi:hypothetical protein